jgi:hypothetical protein
MSAPAATAHHWDFYADALQCMFGIQIAAMFRLTKRETVQQLLTPFIQALKASTHECVLRAIHWSMAHIRI